MAFLKENGKHLKEPGRYANGETWRGDNGQQQKITFLFMAKILIKRTQ
jgi:hypothetical protein